MCKNFNMFICWCQPFLTTLRGVSATLYIFIQYFIEFSMFYFFSKNKKCYVLVSSNTRNSVALQPEYIPCSHFAIRLSDSWIPFYSTESWTALTLWLYIITEKAMATHSSTLAWKIPWMEEPGRLQSMESLRVGQDWVNSLSLFTFMHCRRKWQPTPVFLPGKSQGRGSLVGGLLWGRTELDMTEAI